MTSTFPRLLQALFGDGGEAGALRSAHRFLVGAVLFFFPFGIAFVAGGLLPERFSWTASVVIALGAGATLAGEMRARALREALAEFGIIVLFLFALEYCGLVAGIPFGRYAYTGALGFRVMGVPAAIPLAWYATLINAWRIARALLPGTGGWRRGGVPVLTGILTLALDILLEPMAAYVTGYWIWESGAIPLQNYGTWFLVSVAAAYLLSRPATGRGAPVSGIVGGSVLVLGTQAALFVATILVRGHISPVICALALSGAGITTARIAARARGGR
jgi:uncharacterized membrane protein